MQGDIESKLGLLVTTLDTALEQVVEDPAALADSPVLQEIMDLCSRLKLNAAGSEQPPEYCNYEQLIWQIRSRAGKLQMLLHSSALFYAQCFSVQGQFVTAGAGLPTDGMAYGVHGEWSSLINSSHLVMDC